VTTVDHLSSARGARALRRATVWTEPEHVAVVRVSGPGAEGALSRLTTAELRLYDSQARPSLILREDGTVLADVVIARAHGGFLLFVDGVGLDELRGLLREAAAGAAVEVDDVLAERMLVSFHGPYSWELVAAWLGRFVVALPPLSVSTSRDVWLLRSGRTGEYGYEALVPRALAASERDRWQSLGEPLDLRRVTQESIDRCTLEAGGFVARRASLSALRPAELQLRWRVALGKEHRGATACARHLQVRRITWFVADEPLAVGMPVDCDGEVIGAVLTCEPLSRGRGCGGIALLDLRLAHPGLRLGAEGRFLATASAPLVEPTSSRIRAATDSYTTRDRGRDDDEHEHGAEPT
jgi:glycine cleavage system aminomethyltransferase T